MPWVSRIPQIMAGMEPKAAAAVQKAAADIESGAKSLAPVDTGYLRSSIQHQPTGAMSAQVTCGAYYGIYQEFGTYKMAARPFMVPAAERVRPAFTQAVSQIIR